MVLLLLSLVLAACGGGGGDGGGDGGGGSAPPANGWGTAALIETNDAGSASSPQIAFDASGNAIAVWNQYDDATLRNNIWANRYTATTGTWGAAALIETDDTGTAFSPQIAFDAAGNAIAVWRQFNGTLYTMWANRYIPPGQRGSGWGTAAAIDIDLTNASFRDGPQLVIDASGNAIAVWSRGTPLSIYAVRYVPGTGWGAPTLIETGTGIAFLPQVAVDAGGNAIAVWYQHDGARYNIYANRYTATTGTWGTAALIEFNNAGSASSPQIAFDAGGNAIAVWAMQGSVTPPNYSSIYAAQYMAVTDSWGPALLIETDNAGNAFSPQIAVDAGGNAIAVWEQSDGALNNNIWANRYTAGSGWGTAALIETDAGYAYSPQIAIDAGGNAIAVWSQDGARTNIWANRYQ